jgi:hypothetical protein
MTTQLFSAKFKAADSYVQNRYAILVMKQLLQEGYNYIYYTDVMGYDGAVANGNYSATEEEAINDLSHQTSTPVEYVSTEPFLFVERIEDRIAGLQSDANYSRKFWKPKSKFSNN